MPRIYDLEAQQYLLAAGATMDNPYGKKRRAPLGKFQMLPRKLQKTLLQLFAGVTAGTAVLPYLLGKKSKGKS